MTAQPQAALRVSLVQYSMVWEQKSTNLQVLSDLLAPLQGTTDLIVLPEMFATGFSMNAKELAEASDGPTVLWMQQQAKEMGAVVTGSVIIKEAGNYFNRLHWVRPDGSIEHYDKKHLFSFANEGAHYSAGNKRIIVDLNGWKICPLICYDLRFPVWSRNVSNNSDGADLAYDVLIYVANWPEARKRPWKNLLEARAHENQAYVVGVNRVGPDGNDISHSGDSLCFSPKGELLASVVEHQIGVATVELSYQAMVDFREKFTAWKDWDSFELTSD